MERAASMPHVSRLPVPPRRVRTINLPPAALAPPPQSPMRPTTRSRTEASRQSFESRRSLSSIYDDSTPFGRSGQYGRRVLSAASRNSEPLPLSPGYYGGGLQRPGYAAGFPMPSRAASAIQTDSETPRYAPRSKLVVNRGTDVQSRRSFMGTDAPYGADDAAQSNHHCAARSAEDYGPAISRPHDRDNAHNVTRNFGRIVKLGFNQFNAHLLPPKFAPLVPVHSSAHSAKSPTRKARGCFEGILQLLRTVLYATAVISATLYVRAWLTAGYCPSANARDLDLQVPTPQLGPWQQFAADYWPKCTRCPTHAECLDQRVVGCTEGYVLRGISGLDALLRNAYCHPDIEQRQNVEKLIGLTVDSLRRLVGTRQCSGSNQWVGKSTVRQAISDCLARQTAWDPKQGASYADLAFNEIFLTARDDVRRHGSSPSDYRLTVVSPIFPLACRVKRAAINFAQNYCMHLLGTLLAIGIGLRMWRQHKYREWCRQQVLALFSEILRELDNSGRPHVVVSHKRDEILARVTLQSHPRWVFERIWKDLLKRISETPRIATTNVKRNGEITEIWLAN